MKKVLTFLGVIFLFFGFSTRALKAQTLNWTVDYLSQPRIFHTAVTVGDKVFFAGGDGTPYLIDIYDDSNGTWSTDLLPSYNRFPKSIAFDDKAFFFTSSGVDIYNPSTNSWETDNIYQCLDPNATSETTYITVINNELYVSAPYRTQTCIYNAVTDSWTTRSKSSFNLPSSGATIAAKGSKILFAGGSIIGLTARVYAYDVLSDSWSMMDSLSIARQGMTAKVIGDYIYFAGGAQQGASGLMGSTAIDVYNMNTNQKSTFQLPTSGTGLSVEFYNNLIFFAGGIGGYGNQSYERQYVEIYDTLTQSWTTYSAGFASLSASSVVNNKILFAGGRFSLTGYSISDVQIVELTDPNQSPISVSGDDQIVNEGQSVVFDGSLSSDPDNDPLSFSWSVDSGICSINDPNIVNPTVTCDDNGVYNVILVVSDGTETASGSLVLTVNNVSPTALLTISPTVIFEGESATLSFSNQYDSSSVDTTSGFTYSYDCTNDGVFEVSNSTSASYSCSYPTNGMFAARGRIEDKDGGFSDYFISVIVQTASEAVDDLIDVVISFNLQNGIENSLDQKLEAAQNALDDININNNAAAINSLQAFINAVEAQRGIKITNEQADVLIAAATEIINYLSL